MIIIIIIKTQFFLSIECSAYWHNDQCVYQWHINLHGLFNAKALLLEEQQWYYLTLSWEDKGVHTFPYGICPKVNIIAQLEFELANYDSAVHRFNHYTMWIPPLLSAEDMSICIIIKIQSLVVWSNDWLICLTVCQTFLSYLMPAFFFVVLSNYMVSSNYKFTLTICK